MSKLTELVKKEMGEGDAYGETRARKIAKILFTIPKRNTGKDISHYDKPKKENIVQQADLLYLPTDKKGYKYLLIVVDIATNKIDAQPLKDRTSTAVKNGIEKIYNRDILKIPFQLCVDPGSEFKGEFEHYIESKKIYLKRGATNQHSQQAFVEYINKLFGQTIGEIQTEKELETGKTAKSWEHIVPALIKVLNDKASLNLKELEKKNKSDEKKDDAEYKKSIKDDDIEPTIKKFGKDIEDNKQVKTVSSRDTPVIGSISKDILDEGDKVRLALNRPIDHLDGKRLHGTFRAGDVRWTKDIHTISKVLLLPNQVPRYMIDGITDRSYTRNQLLKA